MHRSSNCCKDIPRNLRSTSVSKGSVIQSRFVILALFSIPFPGLDPDRGRGLSSWGLLRSAPCLAASFRLVVAERRRASEPDLLPAFDCCDGRHDAADSHSSRFRLRDSAQAAGGVAVRWSSWVAHRLAWRSNRLPWRLHPPRGLCFSDVVSRPVAAYPQNRPSCRFFRCLAEPILAASVPFFAAA